MCIMRDYEKQVHRRSSTWSLLTRRRIANYCTQNYNWALSIYLAWKTRKWIESNKSATLQQHRVTKASKLSPLPHNWVAIWVWDDIHHCQLPSHSIVCWSRSRAGSNSCNQSTFCFKFIQKQAEVLQLLPKIETVKPLLTHKYM